MRICRTTGEHPPMTEISSSGGAGTVTACSHADRTAPLARCADNRVSAGPPHPPFRWDEPHEFRTEQNMSDTTTDFDPTDGTTPVTLPTQDACCQSPCDPPWQTGPSCITFTETKTSVLGLEGKVAAAELARGSVTVTVTYAHRICLIGKQHGGLAYTLTLLPGETMTLYQSDRYRRTTSETARYSVQTTFAQFVSALYQQQNSSDSSLLVQVLNNQAQSSGSAGGGFNPFTLSIGGGSSSSSSGSSSAVDLPTQSSADQFFLLAP